MDINDIEVINIRPMTDDEKSEYFEGIKEYMDVVIFCVELTNGMILYPKDDCIKSMLKSNCLLNLNERLNESKKHSCSKT